MAETTRSQTTEIAYVVEFRNQFSDSDSEQWNLWDVYREDEKERAERAAEEFSPLLEARIVKETVERRTTVTREVLT